MARPHSFLLPAVQELDSLPECLREPLDVAHVVVEHELLASHLVHAQELEEPPLTLPVPGEDPGGQVAVQELHALPDGAGLR